MKQNMYAQPPSQQPTLVVQNTDPLQIHADYELLNRISVDANGPLYRARKRSSGRNVAIRLFTSDTMPATPAPPSTGVPIVQVVDTHEILMSHTGIPFAVMELPAGICLGALLSKKGMLPAVTALQIAFNVSLVVRSLHVHHMLHGHIDAQNIFLKKSIVGSMKIQMLHHHLVGSPVKFNFPGNLSPELCGGNGVLHEKDDIWAIGVLLHRMLFGKLPFTGASRGEVCQKIQHTPYTINGTLLPEMVPVAQVLNRCLSKNPVERLDGRDLNLELKSILTNQRKSAAAAGVFTGTLTFSETPIIDLDTPVQPLQKGLQNVTENMEKSDTADVTDLSADNSSTETRRSIDTRLLAAQEQSKARRVNIVRSVSTLMIKKRDL